MNKPSSPRPNRLRRWTWWFIVLSPVLEDFNEDLRRLGLDALRASLRVQLAPQDVARFMAQAA